MYTYVPPPPLSDFVDLFWWYTGPDPAHAKERLLPDGAVELVIDLRDQPLRIYDRHDTTRFQCFGNALVCGPHSEASVIDTANQASIMGVHFKPGGAFPFFNLPADEMSNTHVALDTLWGAAAGEMYEQLLAAPTPAAKFRVLAQTLLAHPTRPLTRHPAVAGALQLFQATAVPRPVAAVTEQIGLSQRRFIQVFRAEVGLTPKLFCRVRRFQAVLRCLDQSQPVDWTGVALTCGYYDQAHFIHDFQALAGLNPTTYLARRTEHFNHVPLPE